MQVPPSCTKRSAETLKMPRQGLQRETWRKMLMFLAAPRPSCALGLWHFLGHCCFFLLTVLFQSTHLTSARCAVFQVHARFTTHFIPGTSDP